MADPQVVLEQRFAAALAALGTEAAGADPIVRPSQRADYQMNAAMGLKSKLGRNPREIADDIVAAAELDDIAEKVEIAGPGFVNIDLRDRFLVDCLTDVRSPMRGARTAETPQTVVIDYSGPNVAKEMHVGHVRSTVIGDALAHLMEFAGHTVIRQNHVGDWGTPFGMLIEHLLDLGEDEAAHELSVSDLNAFYQAARQSFDRDEAFAERSRQRVVALQAGDPETIRLWELLVGHSQRYFTTIYRKMDVSLSAGDFKGESAYNVDLQSVVDELRERGLLVENDGALCVFPPGFENRDGEPLPVIVQKSDGGFGYPATDLAALRHRFCDLAAGLVLYVVGAPQSDHFAMVFKVAEMAGWITPPAHAEHVAFGSILGADGRMFRTRSGESVRLGDLLDEAIDRALAVVKEKSPDLPPDEMQSVAHSVGVGAVKYADLSTDRIGDYVFDWNRMLSLVGNTAPYLQIAQARCRAIFRRADVPEPAFDQPVHVTISNESERELVKQLLQFDAAVQDSIDSLKPHRLCTYLFKLAQTYQTFYEASPVLKAESDELRASRLDLCDLTAGVLSKGLDLLGIDAPERI